jgi:diacylglycerol kinase family enzyme
MVSAGRRVAAAVSLVAATLVVPVMGHALWGSLLRAALGVLVALAVVPLVWVAVTRTGPQKVVAGVAMAVLLVFDVVLVATGPRPIELLVLLGLAGVAAWTGNVALPPGWLHPGEPVGAAERPVLIINPRSGDGRAERTGLAAEAERRGIEVVLLEPGDDLRALAVAALDRGADVLGMAGGDGSQALVASMAAERDVAHVCVPAGTRNHLALDLGLDRDDVVAALGGFAAGARERRVDLAEVNGLPFVNNVSLGVYARIVQEPGYRGAKRQTTARLLPELLGPDAEAVDLQLVQPDGSVLDGPQVVQVSNDPYTLGGPDGSFGRRTALDRGVLGVAAVKVSGDLDVTRLLALQAGGRLDRFPGWSGFEAAEAEVRSNGPVPAGIDGEGVVLEPPLLFRSRPGVLRVRVPASTPGVRVSARRGVLGTARDLLAVAAGREVSPAEAP